MVLAKIFVQLKKEVADVTLRITKADQHKWGPDSTGEDREATRLTRRAGERVKVREIDAHKSLMLRKSHNRRIHGNAQFLKLSPQMRGRS